MRPTHQDFNLKEAYETLYRLVSADPEDHFVFTSSGAEAINHVIFSAYVDITRKTGKNHFITAKVDEAPAIMAMSRLHELGCVHEMAPVDKNGRLTAKTLSETLSPRTALVSISWANDLTGVIQPVLELSRVCRERGVLFHVDATHVLGKGTYTFEESGADFLTFEGTGFQGPAGTGGLFIRKDVEISPFILGGKEQAGMRAGSFASGLLIDLAEAASKALLECDSFALETARLKSTFENCVCEKIAGAKPLFLETEALPHISVLAFPGVTSELLLYLLRGQNVQASFGGGNYQHLKHILSACGIKSPLSECGLSFSFSSDTGIEKIEKSAQNVCDSVQHLQKYSQRLMKEAAWD